MITARPITCPYLGRRWRVRCDRCAVDLPGRYPTRKDAEVGGATHVELRHTGTPRKWSKPVASRSIGTITTIEGKRLSGGGAS